MHVTVNGEPREVREGLSIDELLTELGLATSICAAEVNQRLVPRDERSTTTLTEGDTVEVVTLVGGG